jgi:hypothetical protein
MTLTVKYFSGQNVAEARIIPPQQYDDNTEAAQSLT